MSVTFSVLARAVSLVISLICGVLTARMILGEAGVEYYALYALITALPTLIAFSDLGSGAVLVNSAAAADDVRHDDELQIKVTSVGRIMVTFAAVGLILNAILLLTGGWTVILGDAGRLPEASLSAFVTLSIYCLAIPLGIYQRLLLGLRKNHIVILVQTIQGPVNLGLVWLILHFGGQLGKSFVSVSSTISGMVVGVVGFIIVWQMTKPLLANSGRDLFRFKSVPGVRVMNVGWPMLAQLLTVPLSISMQRYILAQHAPAEQVAIYAAAGQVFFAVNSLISAGGLALWPIYSRARDRGGAVRSPFTLSIIFGIATSCVCLFIGLISPWLFAFTTNNQLVIPLPVIVWFSAMVVAQSLLYPLGMSMMDERGIKFQVFPVLLMAISTVVLAMVLTPRLGVTGPLIANTASVILFQLIPFAVYVMRHRQRLLPPVSQKDAQTDMKSARAATRTSPHSGDEQ